MPQHHRPSTSILRLAAKPLRSFRTGYDPVLNGVAHGLGDLFPPVPHPGTIPPDDPRVAAPAASVERSRTA